MNQYFIINLYFKDEHKYDIINTILMELMNYSYLFLIQYLFSLIQYLILIQIFLLIFLLIVFIIFKS